MSRDEKLERLEREGRNTSSTDPKMMNSRVFIGNLAAEKVSRQSVEKMFGSFGRILGVSLHKSYGFVQFDNEEDAKEAVKANNGAMVHGLRLDVNIATERRKEPLPPPVRSKRPPQRSPSPPPRFRDRYEFDRGRPWDRFGRRSPPPPPHFRPREPYHDPYYDRFMPPMRDPYGPSYGRPRDDPFDRYRDRYPPPRDFPPYPPPRERDFPPYRDREPFDRYPPDYPPAHEGREREPFDSPRGPWRDSLDKKDGEKLTDMEIVVVNRQQKDYADLVRNKLENMRISVEMVHLSPTVSLADALDDAAQRGLLYAMIITSQHEMHRSVTLTILHGRNPQEHKNMPIDDALGLVDRDFARYCQNVREGRIPPRRPVPTKDDVSQLLTKAASGEKLNQEQLHSVINALQKQKHNAPAGQPSSGMPSESEPSHNSQSSSSDDIQRQQADLQAKILSLLGSNAVVPSSSSHSSQASQQSSGYDGSRSVSYPQPGGARQYEGYGGDGGEGVGRGGGYDAYGYGGYR